MSVWLLLCLLAASPRTVTGDRFYASGEFERAAIIYRQLLKESPLDALLLIRLGSTQYQLGFYSEAENLFRRAVALAPASAQAQVGLGTSLLALGRSLDAIPFLEKAIKLTPLDRMGLRALGHAYQMENDFFKGEHVLRSLVAIDPNDAESWYYLGALQYESNYYVPALESLNASLELQPSNDKAEIYKAGALFQLGRNEQAEALFGVLMDRRSAETNPELWLGYAQFLFETEKPKLSLEAINRALVLSPDSAKLHFWRARIRMSLGDAKNAETDAQKAIQLAPDLPNAHNLLMKIYRLEGLDQAAETEAAWLVDHVSGKPKRGGR